MKAEKFVPLEGFDVKDGETMTARSKEFFEMMKNRRTVREYSDKPVPREVIENAILTAGRAPSGANKQPWHFAAISSAEVKTALREAAEEEEREFYGGRASDEWLKDLEPFGTDANKPFIETAPWLIAVFRETYGLDEETGERSTNYYVHESVGIACGFLLAALHNAGLATLTHTPSPMGFLSKICGRPNNEKPIMLIVAGYPEEGVQVPNIDKKSLEEISTWI
ncbi:nitroreductase family protein [Kordiimonas sp. SCSIO 12603]|uniref:nitroreductase family protein n=1 Tax=Kordiimonas sp. SCSIO 12603 TaxID=2829596 RepID=UPI0021020525|nr:nitroreductase family protein [Kordiimonas sp. SCSIO 12603]UTW59360.1 nitroreductase family protein [Kordiimonas sp. SCSIO 12603]